MKQLNAAQRALIEKSSISSADILKHLDTLNEEITETYSTEKSLPTITNIKEETIMQESIDAQLAKEVAAAEAVAAAKRAAMQAALEAAKEAAPKEEEKEELSPEEQRKFQIFEILSKVKGAPTLESIEKLKLVHGKNAIHVLALGEDDIYIFTPLKRSQWQQIQRLVEATKASEINANPEELAKEKVVQYCVLWPQGIASPEFLYNSKAGVIDAVYQSIMLQSYFLSPQQTMMLTTQL